MDGEVIALSETSLHSNIRVPKLRVLFAPDEGVVPYQASAVNSCSDILSWKKDPGMTNCHTDPEVYVPKVRCMKNE